MISYDKSLPQGVLPQIFTFETELEGEAQRADVLATAMIMVAEQSGFVPKGSATKERSDLWSKAARVSTPKGLILGTLLEQEALIQPKDEESYWTEPHPVTDFSTEHSRIRYKAMLEIL